MTEKHIPESSIAINPIVIDDSKRGGSRELPIVTMHRRMGWRFYFMLFCMAYTMFGIFIVTYLWILSHVFGFNIVGCIVGWCP